MKQFFIRGICLFLCVSMTACMGEGGDTINYHRVGVVREQPMRCIYTTDELGGVFIVSSPEFEQREDLKDGDCCEVDFKTNFSEDLGNGVYKAEIVSYDSVAVWPMEHVMTDTTRVFPNEQLFNLNIKKTLYVDGHLFLFTDHSAHVEGQKDFFQLSYNPEQEVELGEEGERIYNLYLRSTQWQPQDSTARPSHWYNTEAFRAKDFLEEVKAKEIQEGQDAIHFKINYAERFDADTTRCVWKSSELFTLRFSN